MEPAETALPYKTANAWAIAVCAFTGALGVFTGFAVFILLRPTVGNNPLTFWLGLAAAALASFVVEMLRDNLRGEIWNFGAKGHIAQVLVTLVTLALFELFIFATHNAVEIVGHPAEMSELRDAILGPALQGRAGATRDLLVLALLWLVAGSAVGAALGAAVVRERSRLKLGMRELRSARAGLLAGVIAAPLAVLAYVLVWRVVVICTSAIEDPSFSAHRITMFLDRGPVPYAPVSRPEAIWRGVLVISTLWARDGIAAAFFAVVLAGLVALGFWRKVWWPLKVTVAFLALGIFAPLGLDLRDLVSLPALAAIVWIVPGVVLGLAAPLLDRPSERTRLWSMVAAILGLAVAAVTVVRLHDPRYFALALLLFGVAAIFVARRDIEQFWPALALCLAIASSGLSFAAVQMTASFHRVLTEVSRINALPALTDRPAPLSVAENALADVQGASYAQPLAAALKNGRPEQLRAAEAEFDGGVLAERNARIEQLLATSRQKQKFLRELEGALGVRDPYYRSLDGIMQLNLEDLTMRAVKESREAEDRRDLAGNPREGTFWARYYDSTINITDRIETLYDAISQKKEIDAEIENLAAMRDEQRLWQRERIPEQLEIALAGATAFWMTVGLLAAWALRRRAAPPTAPAAQPAA